MKHFDNFWKYCIETQFLGKCMVRHGHFYGEKTEMYIFLSFWIKMMISVNLTKKNTIFGTLYCHLNEKNSKN